MLVYFKKIEVDRDNNGGYLFNFGGLVIRKFMEK